MVVEEHHSPDGVLTFVVETFGDDVALGFAQSPWHTHANFLVPTWGSTEAEAVRAYRDALLSGEAVIAVRRKDGAIVETCIIEDLDFEADMACEGETFELRRWDGRPWVKVLRMP